MRPELLIPANNAETLRIAVMYGADAVYIGGEALSLREKAGNFTLQEMADAISFAHEKNVLVYVAANVFARNSDIVLAEKLLPEYAKAGADGFIMSDPGMIRVARRVAPSVPVHISTQANNTNIETWRFWHDLGVTRLVAARELSLKELKEIHDEMPEGMEIECFVHGAMCISYSGRCLISSYLTGRDGNHGACTHPCRWEWSLHEKSRPDMFLPVEEDAKGTFLYFSKDLCMIEHLPELLDAGVASLKVEGRMKNSLYVATVTRAYRRALDDLAESEEKYRANVPSYLDEIFKGMTRDFCTGFFFGQPGAEAQRYEGENAVRNYRYLGFIEKDAEGRAFFRQKNKFSVGDCIEIMRVDGDFDEVTVLGMKNEKGESVESCPHPGEVIYPEFGSELCEYDILRIKA